MSFLEKHKEFIMKHMYQDGVYVPMYSRTGLAKGVAVGISIAGTCGLLSLVIYTYVRYFRKKEEKAKLPTEDGMALSTQDASGSAEYESSASTGAAAAGVSSLTGIMVAKSMEFSYQELAKGTNNFSLDIKIGQGGFGAVYYAIKRRN